MSERNEKGQFGEGNQAAKGHGRPPKAREAALIAIGQEIVNAQTWRAIVNKAALDALGKIASGDRAVDDPNSTAQGRNTARVWIRDTFIGKPTDYISADLADSAFEQLAAYSPAELAAALDVIRGEIANLTDGGGDAPARISAESETGNAT